ncbi:MAG: ATP-binding protein [Candidatus Tritonobacter lacicola]|nr:ATP-binding protein [Candidatus Tritonobacter lacicola]
MRQLVIISGKGGTGKTVISASFAVLAAHADGGPVMADCDVDAADLHLLLHPRLRERHEFKSGRSAVLREDKCTGCGKCVEVCRFSAIRKDGDAVVIDPIPCEGCALCSRVCPAGAIEMVENISGEWFISDTVYGPLVHARLGVAEENSGKLVTLVRAQARRIAGEKNKKLVITDGPPGIGCPVISSIAGADCVLVVTEPTMSGIHDMERVIDLARHFRITPIVCVNKYDINEEKSKEIEDYCAKEGLLLSGKIPFDRAVPEALVKGKTVVEDSGSAASEAIRELWNKVKATLKRIGETSNPGSKD